MTSRFAAPARRLAPSAKGALVSLAAMLSLAALSLAAAPARAEEPLPPAEIRAQEGHGAQIDAISVSPDGRLALSGSRDGTARLWDVPTGRLLRVLERGPRPIDDVAISPDGRFGATHDGSDLVVRDLTSGAEVFRRPQLAARGRISFAPRPKDAPPADPSAGPAAARPNAYLLATAGLPMPETGILGLAVLVDLARGTWTSFPAQGSFSVISVALSPDGRLALVGRESGALELCSVPDGKLVRTLSPWVEDEKRQEAARPVDVAFSRSGARAAALQRGGPLEVFDVAGGKRLLSRALSLQERGRISFGRDERVHIAGHVEIILDPAGASHGTGPRLAIDQLARLHASTLTPDGTRVLVARKLGPMSGDALEVFDARTGARILECGAAPAPIGGILATPDGALALTWSLPYALEHAETKSGLRTTDLASGRVVRQAFPGSVVGAAALSRDGKRAVAIIDEFDGTDGRGRIFEVASGRVIADFAADSIRIRSCAFTPDGTRVALGRDDGSLLVVDAESGAQVKDHDPGGPVLSLAPGPKGRLVYAMLASEEDDEQGILAVIDLDDGDLEEKERLERRGGIASSPDGKHVLVSDGEDLLLFDEDLDDEWRLKGAAGPVTFAPSGARFAVRGETSVAIRETKDGALVRTFDVAVPVGGAALVGQDGGSLLTGGRDGVLRRFRAASGECVYSAYAGAGEHLAITPDGCFDGTDAAARRWVHVVQGTRTIALDQLHERFFDPAVIRARSAGAPIPRDRPRISLAAGLRAPPLVRIVEPASGARVATPSARVVVEALDQGGGIDEVRLYQNGKLVSEETRGFGKEHAPSKTAAGAPLARAVVFDVLLGPGTTRLRAMAISSDRIESAPAEADVTLDAPRPGATLHVLSVGINAYKNTKYTLRFARGDAESIAKALATGGAKIFAKVEVRTLLDGDATRAGIEAAFRDVASRAAPGDVFVFSFAGHGVMSAGDEKTPPEFHLVPPDVTSLYADDAGLAARAVPMSLLRSLAKAVPAQKQLILLDACQAGGALDALAVRGAAEERAIVQLARATGSALLAAAGTEQSASEVAALGHGVFTRALLDGLAGAADGAGAGQDGKITVAELKAYLEERVPALTLEHGGRAQYPTGMLLGQDFPLVVK